MLTKIQVTNKVFAIYGDTQEEVGKAFVRFQEYYENKDLKGTKGITVNMVETWWARECKNQIAQEPYYTYWTGFNLPGSLILSLMSTSEFRSGFSLAKFLLSPFSYPRWYKEEDELVDLLQDLTAEQILNSYFIGLSKDSEHVLDHELAHGMWATDPVYKAVQMVNLSKLPSAVYDKLRKDLIDSGYHSSVVHDEAQAYLSTYTDTLAESFETHDYDGYTALFETTFKDFIQINQQGFRAVEVQ